MTVDLLEERLRELDIPTPDAGRVSARVLAAKLRRRRLAVPRLVSVPAALVLVAALLIYFVPAADLAIAEKTPWSGEILQRAGLVGAQDRITVVNATAYSSGYKLTLQGAYADSTRTVVLVHIEPAAFAWVTPPTITDQFFRTYQPHGGSGNLLTGDNSLEFEPLASPDSITGARITLHVRQLETPAHQIVQGTWELTAALRMDVAKSLTPPPAGDLGPAHFQFIRVRYTPATIEVDIRTTGVSSEDLSRIIPGYGAKAPGYPPKPGPALQVVLLDPRGEIVGFGGADGVTGFSTGPGIYTLRVSYYGYGSIERVITIPS